MSGARRLCPSDYVFANMGLVMFILNDIWNHHGVPTSGHHLVHGDARGRQFFSIFEVNSKADFCDSRVHLKGGVKR